MLTAELYDDPEPYIQSFDPRDILPPCDTCGAPAPLTAEEERNRDYLNGCPDCGAIGR